MYMYQNEYLRVLLVTISTTNDYENIIQNLYTQYLYAISKVKYIIKCYQDSGCALTTTSIQFIHLLSRLSVRML